MMSWRLRFCSFSISYVSSNQMLESDFAEGLGFASVKLVYRMIVGRYFDRSSKYSIDSK